MRISIHAAQEGCDRKESKSLLISMPFQSTQPKRAATKNEALSCILASYFNPRSPRGLRRASSV